MKPLFYYIIVIALLLTVNANGQDSSNSLDIEITLNTDSISKADLLDTIGKVANVFFSYNPELIEADHLVKPELKSTKISSILIQIIDLEKVGFSSLDNQIILFPTTTVKDSTEKKPVFKIIKGAVTDMKNEESVPFCNIAIVGKAIGTMSNLDGNFTIKIPEENFNDTLRFSCLGFLVQDWPIVTINTDEKIEIQLDKRIYTLKTINVVHYDVSEILTNFYNNISVNYENKYTLLTTFYREIVQENSAYTDISEAVLKVVKAPYSNVVKDDLVKFIKGRKSSNTQPYDEIRFRLKGGPYYITKLDVVKNNESFINPEFRHLYVYEYEKKTLIDGRETYIISFLPISNLRDILYEGYLYIDCQSWALSRIEFSYTRQGLKEARRLMIEKEPKEYKAIPTELTYTVQYKLVDNKWYLLGARSLMQIKLNNREKKQKTKFKSISEMQTTNIEKGDFQRFSRSEIFKPSEFFTEKIVDYDKDFWDDYNIIQPEDDLNDALKDFENHDLIITEKPQ